MTGFKSSSSKGSENAKLSHSRQWFFQFIQRSIENCPQYPLISYACYTYFFLQILNYILSVPYSYNEASSAVKTIILITTLDVHDSRLLVYHIFIGIYMGILLLSFILLHVNFKRLHLVSKGALKIWSFCFYIHPWVPFQFTVNSFLVGIYCTHTTDFMGTRGGSCSNTKSLIFMVYSIIGLISTILLTYTSLLASSAVVTRKLRLFTYSKWEHLFVITYFFAVQIVMIFCLDTENYGTLLSVMPLCGLAVSALIFYTTMNFTNSIVMKIKIFGYSITISTSIILSIGQIHEATSFLASKTLLLIGVLVFFLSKLLLEGLRKQMDMILTTRTKDLKNPLHVIQQYILFAEQVKAGSMIDNTDKVKKKRQELILKGLIKHHLAECANVNCFCKNRSFLFDSIINQNGNESVPALHDRVFLKYFFKDILDIGLRNFPNSIILSFAFTKCCMMKVGHINRAYAVLLRVHQRRISTFDMFYVYWFQQKLRNSVKFSKLNDQSGFAMLDSKFLEFEPFYEKFIEKLKKMTELSLQFINSLDRHEVMLVEVHNIGMNVVHQTEEIEKLWKVFLQEYSTLFRRPYLLYGLFLFQVANQPYTGSKLLELYQKKYISSIDSRVRNLNFDTFDTRSSTFFACIDGSIQRIGHFLYCSHNAEYFTGHARELLLKSNVSTLMSSFFSEHHNAFLLGHVEKGTQSILNRSRDLLLKHKQGYLIPITQRTSTYIDPKYGISYMAMLTRRENFPEYIIMTHDGQIDGCTEKIGKLLGLDRFYSDDSKGFCKLQTLCEEFDSLNRARNVELIFERIWRLQNGLDQVNDNLCRRFFDNEGDPITEYREEINTYLKISNDIRHGFVLRVKSQIPALRTLKTTHDKREHVTYLTLECTFQEQFFMGNTKLIRLLVIELITDGETVVLDTGAKKSLSIYDPVKKTMRSSSSHNQSLADSTPGDTARASLGGVMETLKSKSFSMNFSGMKSSIVSGQALPVQNLFARLKGDQSKRLEFDASFQTNRDDPMQKTFTDHGFGVGVDEEHKTYQTISNFEHVLYDIENDKENTLRRQGTNPTDRGQNQITSSLLAPGATTTNRRFFETDRDELKDALRANPPSNLFNADLPSRYLDRETNPIVPSNTTQKEDKNSTDQAMDSKSSKLKTRQGGQPIKNVIKQIINQNFLDKKAVEQEGQHSIASSTTSSGLRSFAKQLEHFVKSRDYSPWLKTYKFWMTLAFVAVLAFGLAAQQIYTKDISEVNADQAVVGFVYTRLEALVDISRYTTFMLLSEQGLMLHSRHLGTFHKTDFYQFAVSQVQESQILLHNLNDQYKVYLSEISRDLAREIYALDVSLILYDQSSYLNVTLPNVQAIDIVASLGYDLSTRNESEITEDSPLLRSVIVNSMDEMVVNIEVSPDRFLREIEYELANTLNSLIAFAVVSFLLMLLLIVGFFRVMGKLYQKKYSFLNMFCVLTIDELIYIRSEIIAFQQIANMAYLEESKLIEYKAKSQGQIHKQQAAKLSQQMKKGESLFNNNKGNKLFKRGSAKNLNRRAYLKFIPLLYSLIVLVIIYMIIIVQFTYFKESEESLILSQFVHIDKRAHEQSMAFIGIYLLMGLGENFKFRGNPILTELRKIVDELYEFSNFLDNFDVETHESDDWSFLINGNYCLDDDADNLHLCQRIASGAAMRGISGMDNYMRETYLRVLEFWEHNKDTMTQAKKIEFLANSYIIDAEVIYYKYLHPAYVDLTELMLSDILERSEVQNNLIIILTVFLYVLTILGFLAVLKMTNILREEEINQRKILRTIPLQIIMSNMTIKKQLKKIFVDLKIIL